MWLSVLIYWLVHIVIRFVDVFMRIWPRYLAHSLLKMKLFSLCTQ